VTVILGWFGRYNHPCWPCCTSSEESGLSCTSHVSDSLGCGFGEGGDSLECVLGVDNSLEFAFLVWLGLIMPGHSLR